MRIKAGDTWYEVTIDTPIMIELTQQDKDNIANMHSDCTKYACFDDDDHRTDECMLAWMNT